VAAPPTFRRRPDARDWAGRSAFMLACGLAAGWAGGLLIAAIKGGPISEHSADLLATLGGAMAGALATYLGSTLHSGVSPARRGDDHRAPVTTPEAVEAAATASGVAASS
jgi:hypothetical protein